MMTQEGLTYQILQALGLDSGGNNPRNTLSEGPSDQQS